MVTTEFIAAIELGSSKIAGVAGKKNSDGSMQILAYAQEDSSTFIRKGLIFNLDKTAQSLTSIINRLESELNNSITKVYVTIGGQSLRTVRNVVSRDLDENTIISEELVNAILGNPQKTEGDINEARATVAAIKAACGDKPSMQTRIERDKRRTILRSLAAGAGRRTIGNRWLRRTKGVAKRRTRFSARFRRAPRLPLRVVR